MTISVFKRFLLELRVFLAVIGGVVFLAFTAFFTIVFGGIYRLLVHSWLGRWVDTPFVFISAFWHYVTAWVFYYLLLGVRVDLVGEVPRVERGGISYVAGNHPPLFLIPVYYEQICRHVGNRLLTTMKSENRSGLFGLIMGIPLMAMESVIFLRRGRDVSTSDTLEDLSAGIRSFVGLDRTLVMHTDGHRPTLERTLRHRRLYSELISDRYGIEDDLEWLQGCYPRVEGFKQTVFSLPEGSSVFFLFMRVDGLSGFDLTPRRLFKARVVCEFLELPLSGLKKARHETPLQWESRIARILHDRFKEFYLGDIASSN